MNVAMHDQGFFLVENVFAGIECDAVVESLGQDSQRPSRAGARHLMSHPAVAALANENRLLQIAQRALGESAVPFRATLFEKTGRANWLVTWHQDTALPLHSRFHAPGWGPWSQKEGILYAKGPAWALNRVVALRVHLDASNSENGPLRVIPGSHCFGVLSDDEVFRISKEQPGAECLSPRGGILAMRPLLIHASSKARSQESRRVLHIEYADSLQLAAGIRLAIA